MLSVRGFLCFAVVSVLVQSPGFHGLTTPDIHLRIMISDSINLLWAKFLGLGAELGNYLHVDPNVRESSRSARMVTDDDLDTAVALLSTLFPQNKEPLETGRGLDSVYNILTLIIDYFTNTWKQVKSSMWDGLDSFVDWQSMFTNWYFAPLDNIFNFLFRSTSRRARSINAIFDHVNKIWLIPTRKVFAAIVNIQADALRNVMKLAKGAKSPGTQRSTVVAGLYQFKEDFMKFSAQYSGYSKTLYGQKHHMILAELSKREFSLLNEVLNLLTFAIWSGTGFHMVYREIVNECYTRPWLEYTLIEGEAYVDDSYLHTIIDNANAKRDEACNFYKSKMGENATSAYSFIASQFVQLTKTTYDSLEPIPADVVMVDAIAQAILGQKQPECVLHMLCMAGFSKASEVDQHPGVDLILGIVVSGRTNFGGLLKDEILMNLGTPKMAEAIYRGFQNECHMYEPAKTVDCSNIDMFLMNFEPRVEHA